MTDLAKARWTVVGHPLFLDQLDALVDQVTALKEKAGLTKDPDSYKKKNATKRLAAILHLVFDAIPQDPTLDEYRQGKTLGAEYQHWFRAKFFQQYRLFFRYHEKAKLIVIGWVNDEDTKRAYGSGNDAYRVFRKMLEKGHPPDSWQQFLAEARAGSDRLNAILDRASAVVPGFNQCASH